MRVQVQPALNKPKKFRSRSIDLFGTFVAYNGTALNPNESASRFAGIAKILIL
jgi:hypothetical protein